MNPKMSIRFLRWLGLTLLFGTGIAAPEVASASPVFANVQIAQAVSAATHTTGGQQVGRQIYAANCAACHGAKGAGGIGPSLQQIAARRSLDQTVEFIENPVGPMPKLYPGKLSAEQVREVATYIRVAFRSGGSTNSQPHGGPGSMGPGMMYGYGPGGYGPGMMYGNGGYGQGMMNGNGNGGYGSGMMNGNGNNGGYGPGMMYGNGSHGSRYRNGTGTLNLSVNDVKRYFEQWLTAEGNQHVKLGTVKVKDASTITAEVVTKDKDSLVVRYEVNRHTGYVSPD